MSDKSKDRKRRAMEKENREKVAFAVGLVTTVIAVAVPMNMVLRFALLGIAVIAIAVLLWDLFGWQSGKLKVVAIIVVVSLFGWICGTSVVEENRKQRIRDEMDGARVQISKLEPVPLGKGDASWFYVNVLVANSGKVPARNVAFSAEVRVRDTLLTEREESEQMRILLDQERPKGRDLEPGNFPTNVPFFTLPDRDDDFAQFLTKKYPLVLEKKAFLYVFTVFAYSDDLLPEGMERITESCSFFYGSFDVKHNCAADRIYTRKKPPLAAPHMP